MKQLHTTVSTGDKLILDGREATIGVIKNGLIQVHFKINETSGVTQRMTTNELNKLISKNQ